MRQNFVLQLPQYRLQVRQVAGRMHRHPRQDVVAVSARHFPQSRQRHFGFRVHKNCSGVVRAAAARHLQGQLRLGGTRTAHHFGERSDTHAAAQVRVQPAETRRQEMRIAVVAGVVGLLPQRECRDRFGRRREADATMELVAFRVGQERVEGAQKIRWREPQHGTHGSDAFVVVLLLLRRLVWVQWMKRMLLLLPVLEITVIITKLSNCAPFEFGGNRAAEIFRRWRWW